ncbi:MAG: redoxin domain-containing protein [Halothiobacillus sp.]|jgi:thiol-disulfide isomerase/thioredoxin|nr:redoxin domain-containing protein [Halothiobacillus sp.]
MTDDRSSPPDPSPQSAVPPPKKRRRWLRWLIEIALFLGIFLAVRAYMAPKVPESLVHGALPLITAPTVAGGTATIGLPGQPTALVFWATWCPVCHVELPWLNELSKTHQIITVAMQSGDADTVRKYLADQKLSHLTVINDPDGAIARKFGVTVTPTMFFIAPDGHIAMAETGITSAWGIRLRLWWLQHF